METFLIALGIITVILLILIGVFYLIGRIFLFLFRYNLRLYGFAETCVFGFSMSVVVMGTMVVGFLLYLISPFIVQSFIN